MNKRIFIIIGIILAVIAVGVCVFFFLNSERTLEEITLAKHGGGRLRYELDEYTTVEIYFVSDERNGDERVGTCYVCTNYYKKASYSPSGKVFDRADTKEYPCKFTDYSLTLGVADHYTYSVEKRNGSEYVVFSKAFFGAKSWYVNK